jgi:hypothetical protein
MKYPFKLLLTEFAFFYVKCTGFRRGHTGFATIGTLVIIFTSVTIMALLRTLERNDFALALSMSKFLTFEASTGFGTRDDGLSELTDIEIYKELEPHGIAHAKWFISRETGPEVKLNTFLITYNTPDIPISIRIGHYNVRVNPYVPNPVLDHEVLIPCIFQYQLIQINHRLYNRPPRYS